jgi:6,7-dimethyl-8-ribityllumazine synthase
MASKKKNLSQHNKPVLKKTGSLHIGIVVSEWNPEVTHALRDGAIDTLVECGVLKKNIHVHFVPGSFELPLGAQILMKNLPLSAVICLGCVIQGETRHFDFISQAVAQGIMNLGIQEEKPVIFGVLTTDTYQQAVDRSGGKHGNKGVEAAVAALKMILLNDELDDSFDYVTYFNKITSNIK